MLSGRFSEAADEGQRSDAAGHDGSQPLSHPNSGGLLSRFASPTDAAPADAARAEPAGAAAGASQRGWRQLAGGARRLGDNLRRHATDQPRQPGVRDWRATDFATGDLDHWDRRGEAPFEMPPDPDAPEARNNQRRRGGSDRDGRDDRDGRRRRDDRERGARQSSRQSSRQVGWDDAELDGDWDGAWDTGSWDTSWAAEDEPLEPYPPRRRRRDQPPREERNLVGDLRQALDDDVLAESLNTLAQLGAVTRPLSRVSRLRLLMQRRPAAAAMLAFFLLGFMLTCCAPLIPLARLGYDSIDLARHVSHLQQMTAGGTAQLINGSKLSEAQADISAIEGDLYEINGAVAVVGAPLGAVSPSVRNYQLLVRMGYDLTGAAS
ncbi:MAG TPA: hypothetical protein VIC27_03410, partial [Ktedonobacterales bacterium]